MVELFDPRKITIIDKHQYLFKLENKILETDRMYEIQLLLTKNVDKHLISVNNEINKNVKFPPKLIINNNPYLYRRKKLNYFWELYKPHTFHDEKELTMEYDGIFIIINLSLDMDESIYINDIPISVNPGNNIIKVVQSNEKIRISAARSEENVVIIWFVAYYELSE
jgi:hypothetical protein